MPNTMAEAFCEEYLITWTEHGEDFTDWRDGDIFTDSQRTLEASAISLFHPLEEDHLLIVTVFRDRSWIVQQEPPGGTPPIVGTREDEHRIPDLIHRTLEAGPSWFTGTDPKSRTQHSAPTAPAECPNGPGWNPLFPQRPTCFFTSPRRGLLIPARRPKMASD